MTHSRIDALRPRHEARIEFLADALLRRGTLTNEQVLSLEGVSVHLTRIVSHPILADSGQQAELESYGGPVRLQAVTRSHGL